MATNHFTVNINQDKSCKYVYTTNKNLGVSWDSLIFAWLSSSLESSLSLLDPFLLRVLQPKEQHWVRRLPAVWGPSNMASIGLRKLLRQRSDPVFLWDQCSRHSSTNQHLRHISMLFITLSPDAAGNGRKNESYQFSFSVSLHFYWNKGICVYV